MFLYMLAEDIKDNLKCINNTHGFEPNILEKPFPSKADGSWIATGWSTSRTSRSKIYN